MRRGESGIGVTLLQTALIDLGFSMPISTRKTGNPDGIFGKETYDCVYSFQTRSNLYRDGVAGAKTFTKLDHSLVDKNGHIPKPSPPKVPIPPPPVIPPSRHYKIGSENPPLSHDEGSGIWGIKSPERTYIALKQTITSTPFMAAAEQVTGPDAVKQLLHYFRNTGTPFYINLEKMIGEVRQASRAFV
jgi:peptidoglycan hydrolase-like protein with peptidoglycan-binding domain